MKKQKNKLSYSKEKSQSPEESMIHDLTTKLCILASEFGEHLTFCPLVLTKKMGKVRLQQAHDAINAAEKLSRFAAKCYDRTKQ